MNKQIFYIIPLLIGIQVKGITEVKNLNELTQHVQKGGVVVVDVYTSWCGACKQMKPVLEKLAKKHSDITILSHNAESDASIKNKFGIKYYPTFIIFDRNGKSSVEVGGMPESEMDYIIQAAKGEIRLQTDQLQVACPQLCPEKTCGEKSCPAPAKSCPAPMPVEKAAPAMSGKVTAIRSMAELQQHLKGDKVVALYIGTTWCGPCQKLKPIFHQLSEELTDVTFLSADGDEVRDVTSTYLKFGFPNVVIFDTKGGHKNLMGLQTKEDLIRTINSVKTSGAKQVTYTESREDNPEAAPMPVFKPDNERPQQIMTMEEYNKMQEAEAPQKSAKKSRQTKRSNRMSRGRTRSRS